MKKLYFLSIYFTPFIAIAAVFYSNIAFAQTPTTAKVAQGGVRETVLNVAAGKVRIYLPDDIRPGDIISGFVTAETGGATGQEREKNSAELRGYVVEIAGSQQKPWQTVGKKLQSTIRFTLNAGAAPTGMLMSKTGKTAISNFNIPVSSVGITNPLTSSPTANDFHLPTIGQQGRPLEIQGPFDGNFDNTSVKIGGQPVEQLCESPRAASFRSPENVTGVSEIEMKEGDVAKSAPIRILKLDLTAPKTNLMRGEKTIINVAVSGLEGITSSIPLQVVTTGSVNMQGGNTQNITIAPSQVGAGGTYTQSFGLTGIQAGGFNVTATVLADPQQEQAKCKCTCELNAPPILPGRTGKGSYEASVKTAKCEGKREDNCKVSSTTYSWSVVAADSTAEYKVKEGTKASSRFEVEITKSGTLTVSVTVTVTCSDGSTCSATGSKTFDVKK